MKKKLENWIFPLVIMGFLAMLTVSCNKDGLTNDGIDNATATVTLATASVSEITPITASCGGEIFSDGGATITARGVCWATGQTPTISDSKTSDGTGAGMFTSNITGLNTSTTYYVRAYATNSSGTYYGSAMSFTTLVEQAPYVSTSEVGAITQTTASCGGNVTCSGGATVTARGVCWSTSANPTIDNNKTTDGAGTGAFTSSMTGLKMGYTYHVRAYASNIDGTGYGNEVSFTTVTLTIGDLYQGGKIAYILQYGDPGYIEGQTHGLIAAPSDQSAALQWNNGSNITTGATANALGLGNSNTTSIVGAQGAGSYAAQICHDLVIGEYSDWYLPCREELNKLFLNRMAIGGFVISGYSFYWSSNEQTASNAWAQYFETGNWYNHEKYHTYGVRAVRYF
ncbi:MAG: DUF1566 domain-containing protein [Bacteroidetes bacterium]|nr:DUF1566 domain-containing protein [Bacteroidota bacterium]